MARKRYDCHSIPIYLPKYIFKRLAGLRSKPGIYLFHLVSLFRSATAELQIVFMKELSNRILFNSTIGALAAWRNGHRIRLSNKKTRVRILP
jgi:hypothetical protein